MTDKWDKHAKKVGTSLPSFTQAVLDKKRGYKSLYSNARRVPQIRSKMKSNRNRGRG